MALAAQLSLPRLGGSPSSSPGGRRRSSSGGSAMSISMSMSMSMTQSQSQSQLGKLGKSRVPAPSSLLASRGTTPLGSSRSMGSLAYPQMSSSSASFGSKKELRCPNCSAVAALPMKRCDKCLAFFQSASQSVSQLPSLTGMGPTASKQSLFNGQSRPKKTKAVAAPTAPPPKDRGPSLLLRLRHGSVNAEEIRPLLTGKGTKEFVDARDGSFGWTPLFFAAHSGDVALAELLLKAEADAEACCRCGNRALHIASAAGHSSVVDVLLKHGVEVDPENEEGWTPLHWGALAGHVEVIVSLLDAQADIQKKDSQGRSAAMWAARHGHLKCLRKLLAQGLDLDSRDFDGLSLKDHANDHEALRKRLLHGGSTTAATSVRSSRSSIFSVARPFGLTSEGQLDLSQVLSLEDESMRRDTPATLVEKARKATEALLLSCERGEWLNVDVALAKCACIEAKSGGLQGGTVGGKTPLMWAATHKEPAVVLRLVKAKASLESQDNLGWTALHHAVYVQSEETVSTLAYLGANLFAKTSSGDSALHLAARSDHSERLLQVLAAAAAAKISVGNAGPVPQTSASAVAAGTPAARLSRGLDVRGMNEETPLQAAVAQGAVESVTTLLALGANTEVQDSQGRSLYAIAAMQGHEEVLKCLTAPVPVLETPFEEQEIVKFVSKLPVKGPTQRKRDQKPRSSSPQRGAHASKGLEPIAEGDSECSGSSRSPSPEQSQSRSRAARPGSADSRRSSRSMDSVRSGRSIQSVVSVRSNASARSARSTSSAATNRSTASRASRTSAVSRTSRASRRSAASSVGSRASRTSRATSRSSVSTISRTSKGTSAASRTRGGIPPGPAGLLLAACSGSWLARKTPGPPRLEAAEALREVDGEGRTILMQCVLRQKRAMLPFLLEAKADVNASDSEGSTPLMLAARNGDARSLQLLLEAGADVFKKDNAGSRAFDIATGGTQEILRLAEERVIVQRQMPTGKALPSLLGRERSRSPARERKGVRLRVAGLPTDEAREDVKEMLTDLLEDYELKVQGDVEVVANPITLRPSGHAYLVFKTEEEAKKAEEKFRTDDELDSNISVTLEAV